jgi:hypothetical protein
MSGMDGGIYDVISGSNGAQLIASSILEGMTAYINSNAPAWISRNWNIGVRRAYFDPHGV